MLLNRDNASTQLEKFGNIWISLALISIALFLLWLAVFSDNLALKSFITVWVLVP